MPRSTVPTPVVTLTASGQTIPVQLPSTKSEVPPIGLSVAGASQTVIIVPAEN